MFPRVFSLVTISLALIASASAHTLVEPVLGVSGTALRKDVKRPKADAPCGENVTIADALETSNAITARADGSFVATTHNFNAKKDGSRLFTAMVDPTALGLTFVNATIIQNGDLEPVKENDFQDIIVQLPAGLKCSGGSSADLCLVSFKQASGFGNCVVVRYRGLVEQRTSTVSGASISVISTAQASSTSGTTRPMTATQAQQTEPVSANPKTSNGAVTVTVFATITKTVRDGDATSTFTPQVSKAHSASADPQFTTTVLTTTKHIDNSISSNQERLSTTPLSHSASFTHSAQSQGTPFASSSSSSARTTTVTSKSEPAASIVFSFSSGSPTASAMLSSTSAQSTTLKRSLNFDFRIRAGIRGQKERLPVDH